MLIVLALLVLLPLFTSCATFLAGTRLGSAFYYPNVGFDIITKGTPLGRGVVEVVVLSIGLGSLLLAGATPLIPLTTGAAFLLLRLFLAHCEKGLLTAVYTKPDGRRTEFDNSSLKMTAGAVPDPGIHPELITNLIGPFLKRYPTYCLGDVAVGRVIQIQLLIANHSLIPCQVAIDVSVECEPCLQILQPNTFLVAPLPSGAVHRSRLLVRAVARRGAGELRIVVTMANQVHRMIIGYDSVFDPGQTALSDCRITRYTGGCFSAFSWRGDMDHYDETTCQSIEGLSHALSVAARYRFPQTMFLSTRLTLDPNETQLYYQHFGVTRGQSRVPDFLSWVGERVDLVHTAKYPFTSAKPYLLELGNHMHLHYGTDAAADVGNGWKLEARMGEGRYDWSGPGGDSFAEQRDNALKARSMMEERLGYTPKSWAMPDSTNDEWTASAVEAAGCDVLSDSDAAHPQNVLFQPPPHHPNGTKAAELTKRYPGDPQDFIHYSMFCYWLHRGHRLRIPVVFMCHQHLRLYQSYACTRFMEAVMRYVLTRFNGDFHINTVYGIGIYWRDVLSPVTRKVEVSCSGARVTVVNRGSLDFESVPVDLRYADGQRATVLVDLPADSEIEIDPVTQASKILTGTPHGNPTVPA